LTLTLRRCEECGFQFADGADLARLDGLYQQLADPGYVASQTSRARQMQWLLRRIRRNHPGARTLLDVGAGTGLLVAEAQRHGLDAVGIEPSRWLAQQAHQAQLEVHEGFFPHPALSDRRFDVV